jgi:hypothetical protein
VLWHIASIPALTDMPLSKGTIPRNRETAADVA